MGTDGSDSDSEEECIEACASHSNKTLEFQELNGDYFKANFLKNKKKNDEHWPTKCGSCGLVFVSGRKVTDATKELKVTSKLVVHACPWATKGHCLCECALCWKCHSSAMNKNEGDKRPKETMMHLMPGEQLVDGTITAAV